MKKTITFLKTFAICFALSATAWILIGGLLSLLIPTFTISLILFGGIGTGLSCGVVNGSRVCVGRIINKKNLIYERIYK